MLNPFAKLVSTCTTYVSDASTVFFFWYEAWYEVGEGGWEGDTLIHVYKLYGYVPLWRVWFSGSLVWHKV